ncbi:hypothetical protein CF328_g6722, partial [Tilletia controversa]
TQAAFTLISSSKGAKKNALQVVVDTLHEEGDKAAKLSDVRRPRKMTRADDVQTFSFQQTTRSIKQRLPFTFAVVNAIAGADRDDSGGSASSATSNADPQASAIADAFDGLPTSAASLSMEQSGSEQDVMRDDVGLEAWDALIGDWEDDEDLLGARHISERPLPRAATTTRRQDQDGAHQLGAVVAAASIMFLLFGRNRLNSRFALSLGMFLFASRTGRRVVEVLSRLGLSIAYLTVLRSVKDLSKKCRKRARDTFLDQSKCHIFGYDNINWQHKIRNKTATSTTVMKAAVHGALYEIDPSTQIKEGPQHSVCHPRVLEDMLGADMPAPSTTRTSLLTDLGPNPWPALRAQRDELRKKPLPDNLHPSDVLCGEQDDEQILKAMLSHARKAFLIQHGYLRYDSPVPEPPQIWPLAVTKTKVFPLPVLNVDESSVQGNLEVFKQYFRTQLKIPDSFWSNNVLFVVPDAYTSIKIKQCQKLRRCDLSSQEFDRFSAPQPCAAPWHLMYAYIRCLISNYGGPLQQASFISVRNIAERVGFRNLLSEPHNFHDCNRFFQIWFSAASCTIIESALRKKMSPCDPVQPAEKPAPTASTSRPQRPEEVICPFSGPKDLKHAEAEFSGLDQSLFLQVSEDAVREMIGQGASTLLQERETGGDNRDDCALQSRLMFLDIGLFIELQAAISTGDPGRMVLVVKQLVPRFQATGQHNYADTFKPVDLVQENFVYDLKHTWPVGGVTKSIEYRSVMGWLLQLLAEVKTGFWTDLGIASQDQRHSDKKRGMTILSLRRDFERYGVFEWDSGGRRINTFEVIRGDALRAAKKRAQEKGTSTKTLRQEKNVACDMYATGMLGLRGTTAGSGTLSKWVSRRSVAMGKDAKESVVRGQGDESEEEDDILMQDIEKDRYRHTAVISNMDGYEELMDDE